jgi:hypothetical protein
MIVIFSFPGLTFLYFFLLKAVFGSGGLYFVCVVCCFLLLVVGCCCFFFFRRVCVCCVHFFGSRRSLFLIFVAILVEQPIESIVFFVQQMKTPLFVRKGQEPIMFDRVNTEKHYEIIEFDI